MTQGGIPPTGKSTDSNVLDRVAIAKMVTKLFEHWSLTTEEQLDALGLPETDRGTLSKYRNGAPIANQRDALERAGHLLAIHKNLHLLFPHNRELAYTWMKNRNRAFENRSPIEVIREWGFAGLLMVRTYLDRTRDF
jgi:hypothetical protein